MAALQTWDKNYLSYDSVVILLKIHKGELPYKKKLITVIS